MQKRYPLVSIYDAHSDKDIFGNPEVVSRAHALAHALAKSKLSAVGRVGSPVVTTVLTTLGENGIHVVGLSPASTHIEHEKAYRLPHVSFPLVFTGRGALGADLTALSSSHGIVIAGSDAESLSSLLGYVGDRGIPIGIFTEENPNEVRSRVNNKYPNLMIHIIVSKDENKLVQEIMSEMRRHHLSGK